MRSFCITLILATAIGCGSEPASPDGTADTGAADIVADADVPEIAPDASPDATVDAPDDVTADAEPDVAPDTEPDGAADTDAAACRDPDDPRVQYLHDGEVGCDSGCEPGWTLFEDACGCGCEADPSICPDPGLEGVTYVAPSAEACADILFECEEGEAMFSLSCGCGCVDAPEICLDPSDPDVEYVADPETCWLIDYMCEEGWEGFSNPCGCGCVRAGEIACPDASDPYVQYVFDDPDECAAAFFTCEEGGELFSDACGCGCIYDEGVCPDPEDPVVSYIGESPEECARIDWDCFSATAEAFDGPCGCGCVEQELSCPDEADPRIWYAARTLDECSRIRFACPETWSFMELPRGCEGCGCEAPDGLACVPEKFIGTSGLAEPFGLQAWCEFFIACSDGSLDDGLELAFTEAFGEEASCREATAFGCPEGTRSSCQVYVERVDSQEVTAGCTVSTSSAVDAIVCGGDL